MVQKKIQKRNVFDASGAFMGATAALASGIPGEKCDNAPEVAATTTLTAATKYGRWVSGQGLVINPKEGVRYGGSIADGLDVAAGAKVTVATKGHFFVKADVGTAKAALAKGASLYANATTGEIQSAAAGTAVAKVLEAVPYPAAYAAATAYAIGDRVSKNNATYVAIQAGTGKDPESEPTYWAKDPVEVYGDQFTDETVGGVKHYFVIVKAELV